MFKFFKDKVKSALDNFSKKAEEEGELEEREIKQENIEEPVEEQEQPAEEKKGFFAKLKEKFTKKEEVKEEILEEPIIEYPVKKRENRVFDEGYVEVPEEIDKEAALKDIEEEYPEKKFEELKKEALEQTHEKEDITEAQEVTKEITKTIQEATKEEEFKPEEKIEDVVKKIKEKRKEPREFIKETIFDKEPLPEEPATEEIQAPLEEEFLEEQPRKEVIKEQPQEETQEKEIIEEPAQEKKGFFAKIKEKITTTKLGEDKFDELFWDLELAMLENNVAVEVISKIKDDLKKEIVDKPIQRGKIEETVLNTLKTSIAGLFQENTVNILEKAKRKKPLVVCFIGINGSGKTTTIAKIAKLLQNKGLSVVMAAGDTFRAAAIDQLQIHADKLGVKLIRHDYGADAAAVAYDAVEHAKAKGKDVVLIDTAGRLHSNQNLVDEMKKIVKVAKPDLKIFVGESITGNDCIEQAQKFNEAVEIDGIILSKADIDEKGGAALSVSYVTGKPILYLGIGQNYQDLEEFNKEKILSRLGL